MEILKLMKQIENGYAAEYCLTAAGKVFNTKTEKYIKPSKENIVKLKTDEGIFKNVSIKTLYKLVYGKNYSVDTIEDLEQEEWRPVDKLHTYFVSNKGRIKSYAAYTAKIIKPNKVSGYHRVDIVEQGVRSSRLVHRIVAAAFLEPPERSDYQLHHKDFNKTNNNVENLEWLSVPEHIKKHKERNVKNNSGSSDST